VAATAAVPATAFATTGDFVTSQVLPDPAVAAAAKSTVPVLRRTFVAERKPAAKELSPTLASCPKTAALPLRET
jgi:hypothetical protein